MLDESGQDRQERDSNVAGRQDNTEAGTRHNNNNNDFISIALFHVRHAQLR